MRTVIASCVVFLTFGVLGTILEANEITFKPGVFCVILFGLMCFGIVACIRADFADHFDKQPPTHHE